MRRKNERYTDDADRVVKAKSLCPHSCGFTANQNTILKFWILK